MKQYRQLVFSSHDNTNELKENDDFVLDIDFKMPVRNIKSIVFHTFTFTNNHIRVKCPNNQFTIYVIFQKQTCSWLPTSNPQLTANSPYYAIIPDPTNDDKRLYASYKIPITINTNRNFSIRSFIKALNDKKRQAPFQLGTLLTDQSIFSFDGARLTFNVLRWTIGSNGDNFNAFDPNNYSVPFDIDPNASRAFRVGIGIFEDNPYNKLLGILNNETEFSLPYVQFVNIATGNIWNATSIQSKSFVAENDVNFHYNSVVNLLTNTCFKQSDKLSRISNQNRTDVLYSIPILTNSGEIFYYENKNLANEIVYEDIHDFKLEKCYIKMVDEFFQPITYSSKESVIITFLIQTKDNIDIEDKKTESINGE